MNKVALAVWMAATVMVFTGCGEDEHLPPLPESITPPAPGPIPVGGPGQPGGICTSDAECRHVATNTPATCLPLQAGQPNRVCSFYRFTMNIATGANMACYNGSGVQTRNGIAAANVPFASDTTMNEAACVAQGVQSGCTQSGVLGTNLPCAFRLNPSHATGTWNQTPDPR